MTRPSDSLDAAARVAALAMGEGPEYPSSVRVRVPAASPVPDDMSPAGFRAREAAGLSVAGYRIARFKTKNGQTRELVEPIPRDERADLLDKEAPLTPTHGITARELGLTIDTLEEILQTPGAFALNEARRAAVVKVTVALRVDRFRRLHDERLGMSEPAEPLTRERPRRKVK